MTSLPRLCRFIVLLLLTSTDVIKAFVGIHKANLDQRSPSLHANVASGEPTTGRREALVWSGISLVSLLLGGSSANAEEPKTIMITGCSSGIGLEAAKLLADNGHTLVLANRSEKKSAETVDTIRSYTSAGTLLPCACDLGSLKSIETFVRDLPVQSLDISCLNAGLTLNYDDMNIQRTQDGFEITVGTNHFGHFYLNHLLMPRIEKNGKIVVTASGVHDPDSPGGAQGVPASLGNLEGLERDGKNCEMIDGKPYNPDKAYKDSKLCNVLFTRELQRRLSANSATKGISVNSFSPGLITTTGLFRNQNQLFTKAFSVITSNVVKVAETPEWGGAALEYMTAVNTKGEYYLSPPGSSKYGNDAFGNQFKVSPVSIEAQDDAKAKKLWELSEKALGITA